MDEVWIVYFEGLTGMFEIEAVCARESVAMRKLSECRENDPQHAKYYHYNNYKVIE